ncbi:MAG: hypothetical protein ACXW19_09760, partial [Thermoanaerobaculia bacterium]
MDRQQKRYLKDIGGREAYEKMKARKSAAKLRGAARGKGDARRKDYTEENWETLLDKHGRARKRRD